MLKVVINFSCPRRSIWSQQAIIITQFGGTNYGGLKSHLKLKVSFGDPFMIGSQPVVILWSEVWISYLFAPSVGSRLSIQITPFFRCRKAREVWSLACLQFWTMGISMAASRIDCFFADILSTKEMEVVCVTCWTLWNDRNNYYHNQLIPEATLKDDWIMQYMNEIVKGEDLRKHEILVESWARGISTTSISWKALARGWIKINVDAACWPTLNTTRFGIVGRNNTGLVVVAAQIVVQLLSPISELNFKRSWRGFI